MSLRHLQLKFTKVNWSLSSLRRRRSQADRIEKEISPGIFNLSHGVQIVVSGVQMVSLHQSCEKSLHSEC